MYMVRKADKRKKKVKFSWSVLSSVGFYCITPCIIFNRFDVFSIHEFCNVENNMDKKYIQHNLAET